MRTIETIVYTFDELGEQAKEKAIEKLYDINVSFDWWKFVYEDAKNIGLKITGFDLDRGYYCSGDLMLSANEVAQNILSNHGESCDTYKTAIEFMKKWEPIFYEYMDENSEKYESRESEDELSDLEDQFKDDLLSCYLTMLWNEYEYQTSREAIIEIIKANEYEFTEDGKLI